MNPGRAAALALLACAAARAAPPPRSTPSPAPAQDCVSVEVEGQGGGKSYLDCLNQQLARTVEGQGSRQAAMQLQVDGANPSAPQQQGLYNQAATRERLRGNFGVSARPPPPPPHAPPPFGPH